MLEMPDEEEVEAALLDRQALRWTSNCNWNFTDSKFIHRPDLNRFETNPTLSTTHFLLPILHTGQDVVRKALRLQGTP
jgi:hypothetical protein